VSRDVKVSDRVENTSARYCAYLDSLRDPKRETKVDHVHSTKEEEDTSPVKLDDHERLKDRRAIIRT
jgi:hypothetical protein